MADLAIGISRTAVQTLVDKVKSALKEEAELWQIVQRDMVFIQDEFEMMESFLSTADGRRIKNIVGKTWVRQVWDLSHQVEDCAEFVLHLDTKRSWWAFSLRLLPSCCKSGIAQPLDEVVAEIKLLKARVEEVSQRNLRYNLIGDSGSKPAVPMQQTTAAGTFDIPDTSKNHYARGFLDLTKLIATEGEDLQVISVCGTGGDLGKLSIIRKAYDKSRTKGQFRNYAWVKLTYPFRPHDFIYDMVAQFYTNAEQNEPVLLHRREDVSTFHLARELHDHVCHHRYLIVLEDVSSMPVWDAIRAYLPDTKHGSRIVVSTHQLGIARICTGNPYQVSELGQFSEDHYVLVFFKDHNAQHSEGFLRDEVKYQKRSSFVREVASDWKNNCFLVGRDREVHELGEMIRDCFYRNEAYVVSVCGTAGVGKSSIVQTVYNHFVANRNDGMFERFGWVSGSHPLDPMDFSQRLLLDMEAGESSYVEVPTRYAIEACTDVLCRYRCLIVIDGLQFKEDWYSIYHNNLNLSNKCGICIIVITTEDSFLEGARSEDGVFHIKPLEDDIALDLFRKVFPFETVMNENVLEEVKTLLSKCGGLPKQIIALASHLGPLLQRPRGIQERDRARLTANFMHELAMAKRDSMQSIFALMRSSFEGCPQLLRRCIFYLRIFPENSYIRRRRLVRRWMAEGYSKSIGSHSLEDDAEKLFDKIAALGMIQKAQRMTAMADVMRTAPWQVNYLFLEYIISWQEEEKNFLPLEVSVLEGRCSLSTGRIGQHLSIGNSWERDEFVFDSLDSSRLRSLTVYGGWRSFFISNKMRVLRVLDLEGSSNLNDGDLDQIGEMVPHLKFLSLRRCTPISQLPDSLGLLKQLQTLDIKYSSIVVLPKCIVNLRKLQHLSAGTVRWDSTIPDVSLPAAGQLSRPSRSRAGHLVPWLSKLFRTESVIGSHNGGVIVPGEIAMLKALHTLSVVDANASGGGSLLGDLKMLYQLRKLGVSGITEENTRIWDLRFPPDTIKLSLEMAMDWIPRNIIQAAGKLQSLDTLRIKGIGGELEFEGSGGLDEGPFGELKVLQIAFRGDSSLRFEPGSMRKLEQLKVILDRGGSRLSVDGIVCLISLKQVWVKGPLDVEHREQLVRQLDLHGGRPVLKLEE